MAELTSLANLKAWLGLLGTTEDGLLASLITRESAAIENYLNRSILTKTYRERVSGTGGYYLLLANAPITAITTLTIDDRPIRFSPDRFVAGYTFDTTSLWLKGYVFTRGFNNVVVDYVAGVNTVPADIEQACIELCAHRYKERDRIGHTSKTLAGETVAYSVVDMPLSVKALLNPYRQVAPL